MGDSNENEIHELSPLPHGTAEPVGDADEDDGPRFDPFTFERIDPDDSEEHIERVGPPPSRNAWAASMDWEAVLEKQFARAEERTRTAKRLRRLRGLGVETLPRRSYPLDVGDQRGVSAPLTVRLPRWLDVQLRQEFERSGVSVSAALRQVLEEWWVTRRYPALEFRGPDFLRLASIRGGPAISDWASTSPRPALADDVLEQVLDYMELFRGRLRR